MENVRAENGITMSPASGILIAIGLFMVYSGVQAMVAALYAFWPEIQGGQVDDLALRSADIAFNGDALGIAGIVSGIFGISMIFLLTVMRKGNDYKQQLGLRKPGIKPTLFWLAVVVSLGVVLELVGQQFGIFQSDFMEKIWNNTTHFSWLFIAVCVMAPIFEELLFRGLFLDALCRTNVGTHGAVLISSMLFAVVHLQYDWTVLIAIVVLGMVLGYSRIYSRSLFIPLILHLLNNTFAFLLSHHQFG